MNIRRALSLFIARYSPGGKKYCAICEQSISRFLPYRRQQPILMKELNCIGSSFTSFSCPRCFAHDRERHLLLYMRAMQILLDMKGKDVLHFAPEVRLTPLLARASPRSLIGCDLLPRRPELLCVDIQNMPFPDESFDYVIANHVLEHVVDDVAALREITRVLRPGAWAIIQTPYSNKLNKTWQDSGIADGTARLQAYGQEDHVRLYGKDIFSRFESTGLQSHVRRHS